MLFVIILFSCAEKVDLDPKEREIVVHAILGDTTTQRVQLFYTSYLSENNCPSVEEAEVCIEKMKDTVAIERYDFKKVKDGVWESCFVPSQLGIYRLTICVPGRDPITAKTQFPLRKNFVQVKLNLQEDDLCSAHSIDYQTKSFAIDEYKWASLFSFMDYIPETGEYIMAPFIYSYFFADGFTMNDEAVQYVKNQLELFPNYDYQGMYGISRYNIAKTIDSLNWDSGNYIGKTTVTMYDTGCQVGGVRLIFGARDYGFSSPDFTRCLHPLSYLVVQCINKDYELYILDVIAKKMGINRKDVSDLTHLWEKDEIYSNINNALGIFAAQCRYELMVKDYPYANVAPLWKVNGYVIPGWND